MHDLSGGKRELVRLLRADRRHDGEEKLSHLLDLETRLLAAGLSHEDVLLLVNIDKPLLRKARDKILEQAAGRPSRAMTETPRNLLRDRAMRGHWAKFPFDPAAWECTFGPLCRPVGDYGWRMTPVVVMSMENAWKLARVASPSAAARVAADRATLTRIIDLMDHIDDSMAEMAELYKQVLDAYTAEVWVAGVEPEVVLRDGIELGIWENYGLSGDMRMLFKRMPPEHVELAVQVFYETTAELFINGLERASEEAHGLWAVLLMEQARFADFAALVNRMSPATWWPVIELAKVAVAAGHLDVADAVFIAADRPGADRDRIREKRHEILGTR